MYCQAEGDGASVQMTVENTDEVPLFYLQGKWQESRSFIDQVLFKYHGRRLVLDDDVVGRTQCFDLIEAYTDCKYDDDEARRKLDEGDDTLDDDPGTTVNQGICEDLLHLQETSQNPCHDGIYDDGDAGCEAELFSAYSCFFTITCEEEFRCETFDSSKIYDHDDRQENPVADDFQGDTTYLTFYNSFPSADYLVCFTYGPSFYNRHARTAGPLGYGEWLHAEFEGEVLYFNVHTVSPSTIDCDDESRVRATAQTLALASHKTPTNFIGWGPDTFGLGSVDLWRTAANSDIIEDKIFANEAIGFGRCSFQFLVGPVADNIVDPAAGARLPTDIAAIIQLTDYSGINGLQVECDDGSVTTLDIDASKFCPEGSQHFLAVGDREKHFFPLQIMLVQGVPCNDVDLDQVQKPQITGGIIGVSNSAESTTKKKKSTQALPLLITVIVLAIIICCCSLLVLYLSCLLQKKSSAYFAPNNAGSHNTEFDNEDSVIQLGPHQNPIPDKSAPEDTTEMI
eukprot:CAMPEP_0197290554 /NCGR_PEP_ID=MMETSP0890-20130614/7743_1 /TAXON_ID=44058 ORGANISM="Aureoumbra lagunensis, Strain CCMP1510" /NCGR_SAMPLE_ID=MMETSP0890 /ASSEMBLY_ACC=CAM_ASM_000533 /LENGTH=510 /DNA_ID=CAMNT_0042762589 /DNA_START=86 /DNA_END=1618 /DNA_ORIENTATION=-